MILTSSLVSIVSGTPDVNASTPGLLETKATVVAGNDFTIALKNDGTVWAWGDNESGQLGDGTKTERHTPVQVMSDASNPMTNVKSISVGTSNALALKNDGTVWAWGGVSLGNGTTGGSNYPVQVVLNSYTPLRDIVSIACGITNLALKNDGTVWAWGANSSGQVGDGTSGGSKLYPIQVMSNASSPMINVKSISVGGNNTLFLKNDGTVWACGSNSGNLGNGTTNSSSYPVQIKINYSQYLTEIISISAGFSTTYALKNDGTVWACGSNYSGEIGDGTTIDRLYAVQVKIDSSTPLKNVVAISNGIAVKDDSTVWAWGSNFWGQVADGTIQQTSPYGKTYAVQSRTSISTALFDVVSISAGSRHTAVLKNDGTVWVWGNNTSGQIGNGASGSGTYRVYPTQTTGLILFTPATNVIVTGMNGITSITTKSGMLQMIGTVLPTDASYKDVTWSVRNETGSATIGSNGLLTAVSDGTVAAIATINGTYISGEMMVTISGQQIVNPEPQDDNGEDTNGSWFADNMVIIAVAIIGMVSILSFVIYGFIRKP